MTIKTAYNMVLPTLVPPQRKAGLNNFDWAFVQGSTFVLRLNFCAKKLLPSAIPEPLCAIIKPSVLK